jgi:hypothetical protein
MASRGAGWWVTLTAHEGLASMNSLSSPGPGMVPPGGNKRTGIAALFQILALIFAVPAVIWGFFMVWSTAFPQPCGDWSGLTAMGGLACGVVDLPIGLLILVMGLLKNGSPRLRTICIVTAIVTLSLPMIAQFFLLRWHCP